MGLFSIKPQSAVEVKRELILHRVDGRAQWVGPNDNYLYEPHPETDFTAGILGGKVIERVAFNVERTVVARRRVSEAALGEAALIATDEADNAIAVLVPVREGLLGPTSSEAVTVPVGMDGRLDVFKNVIADAIFTVVQRQGV